MATEVQRKIVNVSNTLHASILVIDDEEVMREILEALLSREGHPEPYFAERCQLTWEKWAETGSDLAAAHIH